MPISRIESNSIAPSQTLTTPIIATTMGVGGATPAGSGSGITFPATQSASTDVNTLDDYEEGSWTPRISKSGAGEITSPTSAFGRYVKIGQVVWVHFYFYKSSGSAAGAGEWNVDNLPFTAGTASYVVLPSGYTEINSTQASGTLRWQPNPSTVQLILYSNGASLTTAWSSGFIEFAATGMYQTSA